MDQYEEKLKKYVTENGIEAEVLHFEQSCHTVQEAARAVNAQVGQLVKNICFIGDQDNLIVAIVKGEDKVDPVKVGLALNI